MRKLVIIVLTFLVSTVTFAQMRTVGTEPLPAGFVRIDTDSFGKYLRDLQLRPKGTKVKLYNGKDMNWQARAYAVVDLDIGNTDLQQCADAIIRLRAEWQWANKRYSDIHFNFTSGFRADYTKWADGYRIAVSGNNVSWYKAAGKDYSYAAFRQYLDVVFTYAGTASLSRELVSVPVSDIQIGDIFITPGFPGHAMIVVDLATNPAGKKAMLVAQSYMPAQDIHIVVNFEDRKHSPWYIFDDTTTKFDFPDCSYSNSDIKRFK